MTLQEATDSVIDALDEMRIPCMLVAESTILISLSPFQALYLA